MILQSAEAQNNKTGLRPVVTGLLLLIFFFPFYIYTMSPSLSVGDSGEFMAAAKTLSNPHAPSYPLFSLLGKCATNLVPFAHTAYRINLMSVLLGVGTAVMLFLLLVQLGLPWVSSLLAVSLFAFSNVLWEHSITTEVFSLNGFFALLVLFLFIRDGTNIPLLKRLCLSAFLFGLGMGNHHTLVFVIPPVFLLWIGELRAMGLHRGATLRYIFRSFFLAFLFFLLGFSVYLYLPIRSFKNPPIDWSNPETLHNLTRVITRADYGSLSLTLGEKLPRNIQTASRQVMRYFSYVAKDVSPVGVCLALAGWLLWYRKRAFQSLSFLVFFFVSGIGFLILGNLPFDAQSSGILPRFYLMPAIPLMLALAHSFAWLEKTRFKPVLFFAFLLPAYLLFNGSGHRRFSRHDFAAYDYGRNLLKTLPKSGVLFMDGGDDTFYTLAYLTMAEGRRKDLELHDRGGLIYRNPYGDDFRRIPREEKEMRRQSVEGAFLGVRPLYYSTFNQKILAGAVLKLRGILYEAVPEKQSELIVDRGAIWNFYSYRGVYEPVEERPYRLRALLPLYPFMQALQDGWNMKYFRYAAQYGTDILWVKSNIIWELSLRAYDLSNRNKMSEAESLYKYTLQIDPQYVPAYSNLGVLAEKRNDVEAAEAYYRKALDVDPRHSDAYYNLGVLYWKQNRWPEVVKMFERTLEINPNHPTARRFLFLAQQKLSSD